MPELPEVETVRRGLEPAMVGARFTAVEQRRADLRFAFRFKDRVGDADGNRQHRDHREHRRVGKRRSPDRTTVAHEALPDEHPEVHKSFEPRQTSLHREQILFPHAKSPGDDSDETGK